MMVVDWYAIYVTGPIDHWGGWSSIEDALLMTGEGGPRFPGDDCRDQLHALLSSATMCAIRGRFVALGWEGDGIWRAGPLPNPLSCDSLLMFAVKQQNNGSVFLASPFALPWLGEPAAFTGRPMGTSRR